MLFFNGVRLPTPTQYSTDYEKVTTSRDTLSGRTIYRVIRRKVVITCSWEQLSNEDLQTLLITETTDSGELKYWDEKLNNYQTTQVYVVDTNSTLLHAREKADKLQTVSNITLTFREF